MDPPSTRKTKRSVGKFLSQTASKVFRRSPSPSTSQNLLQAPSTQSRSPSPQPHDQLNPPNILSHPNQVAIPPVPVASTSTPAILISSVGTDPTNLNKAREEREPRASWKRLRMALLGLQKSVGALPPLHSVVGSIISSLDFLEEAATNRHDYDELASDIAAIVELLKQHVDSSTSLRMTKSITNTVQSLEELAKSIEDQRSRGTGARVLDSSINGMDMEKYCRRIESLFKLLQADATLSIWGIVSDHMMSARMKNLEPVRAAAYDSSLSTSIGRRTCTEGTRAAILAGLNDWSHSIGAADVYWMNGMAGTGKTTIAYSFCKALEDRNQLAASFFCTKNVPDCRQVSRIIPTIAYQLAQFSIPFQSTLCEVLAKDPDAGSKNMAKQFEQLLKIPLVKVQEAMPKNLVVVIDALDECEDIQEVEQLLEIILRAVMEVPLKFFTTSRPDQDICNRMMKRLPGADKVLHLHEVEKSLVQMDIELYLTQELEFISPTKAQIKELVRRSDNLFIYAATIARSVLSRKSQVDPQRWLLSILSTTTQYTKQYAALDGLYAAILEAALDEDSEKEFEEIQDVRQVLQTVICVQEPIKVSVLAALTGLNDEVRVIDAIQPLLSVVHFQGETQMVAMLHVSFSDFIFDKKRSKKFHRDPSEPNEVLSRQCFQLMTDQLQFNICGLESSFIPDSNLTDIPGRTTKKVSPALLYACRYWSNHLQPSIYSDSLNSLLENFLGNQLLFWMEVLNLTGEIGLGPTILLKVTLWLPTELSSVVRLVEDARNFVTSFAINPVSQSTPHIYLSLLPFCPRSSTVFQHYWRKSRGLVDVTGDATQKRATATLACWKAESDVNTVVYSPDGTAVAFNYGYCTIAMHSVHRGSLVAGPFNGHTGDVKSVAFSPDGSRLASGSWDKTIRIWDIQKSGLVVGPFEGHSDVIYSVAYSPDGTRIVSGSGDRTVRIWDSSNGALIGNPFEGHNDSVQSVAWSPGGTHIASGSWDRTIRVWNAQLGMPAARPFEGHTAAVWSIAYSPDGARIASGSSDMTVRVWDANSGELLTGPFVGHTSGVMSVAYSPDGKTIASGAGHILVWDAYNGKIIAGPFRGHTGRIQSLAYSPDGTRIVSGSNQWDKTIRFWDVRGSTSDPILSEGHTSSVLSVGYSPNGSHIVSGSEDQTIRVWSAHDGKLRAVTASPKIHTGGVTSVSFSSDGIHIASGSSDRTIRIWALQDDTLAPVWVVNYKEPLHSVMYSPDGASVASDSPDNTVQIRNASDGALLTGPLGGIPPTPYPGVPFIGCIRSVAYSPDGTRIVCGSDDLTIRIWSAIDGAPVAGPFKGHKLSVLAVAFSPQGTRVVSGSQDTTVRVWNVDGEGPAASPFVGHTDWVSSVAYSPDGACIVSSSNDMTIRVWNSYNGTPINRFIGHVQKVCSVAYSPDGLSIVSGSRDNTIRVWKDRTTTHIIDTHSEPADSIKPPVTSSSRETTPLEPALKFHSALRHWTIRHDGWVTDNDRLLFWVPSDIASYLPTIYNPFVITPSGILRINYEGILLGENWGKCFG